MRTAKVSLSYSKNRVQSLSTFLNSQIVVKHFDTSTSIVNNNCFFAFEYWLIVYKCIGRKNYFVQFFFLMRGQSFYSPLMRSNSWVEQRQKLWMLLLSNSVSNFMALWDEDWWFSIERGSGSFKSKIWVAPSKCHSAIQNLNEFAAPANHTCCTFSLKWAPMIRGFA